MNESIPVVTRYLLGELSEREQAEFEARYFEDPQLFDELTRAESSLVDDYVRGRLAPDVRERFEAAYAATPARRERVRFAQSLLAAVDRHADAGAAVEPLATQGGSWPSIARGRLVPLGLAAALVLVVAAWWFADARRTPSDPVRTADGRPVDSTRPSPRGDSPAPTPTNVSPETPATRPVVAVVTLALAVGPGERSALAGNLPTLSVPAATDEVRLLLTFQEHDYPRYRAIVRLVGGPEVIRNSDVVPTPAGASAVFTLSAPASRFAPGDYLLTVQGASPDGVFEDLSQSLFRIR